MPRGFETVVRVMVGGVPAMIAVVVGTVILLIALFLGPGRQTYALQAATCAFDTARALVGLTATTRKKADKDSKVQKRGD
jgi:hypothetical protein